MFKYRRPLSKLLIALSTLLLVSACAPPVKVAVEERQVLTVRQQSENIGGQLIRIVQSGDTLYSIAFASNLDVNQLAAWNGIDDTSKLLVGKRIRLTKPIGFVAKPRPSKQVVVKADRVKPLAKAKVKTSSRKPNVGASQKAKQATVAKSAKPNSSSTKQTNNVRTKAPVASGTQKLRWSWPVNGKVIRRFSPASTQQGIDISAKTGNMVKASAAGEVVYVGNSLKGYGNLIIIKHNENFLSAYAHNQAILVSEGQKIASDQHIGSVGINNRKERALHFQIRRKGKPVNPLSYLSAQAK